MTLSRALLVALTLVLLSGSFAYAQEPTPVPPATPPAPTPTVSSLPGIGQLDEIEKIYAIGRMVTDLLQGKLTPNPDALFDKSKESAAGLLQDQRVGILFLDFADPNLGINQFAAEVARNLLLLTPLYVIAYLAMLVYSVYKERPIPNPLLYAGLVILVMLFLAAFGVITKGLSDLARALAVALSGGDARVFAHATLLDQVMLVLNNLQQNGGLLSVLALVVSIVLVLIILGELVYRGLALVILRLLSVFVIPFSVLLEGTRPRAAGRVIGSFFESWFDLVTKVAVLLIVVALAASEALAQYAWLVLPAGLALVVLSWQFFKIPFILARDAAGRLWSDMVPAAASDYSAPLPSSAEAARAKEIDQARRQIVEE